jgi:hypothetical protein
LFSFGVWLFPPHHLLVHGLRTHQNLPFLKGFKLKTIVSLTHEADETVARFAAEEKIEVSSTKSTTDTQQATHLQTSIAHNLVHLGVVHFSKFRLFLWRRAVLRNTSAAWQNEHLRLAEKSMVLVHLCTPCVRAP